MNKVRGGRVPGDGVLTHERWGGGGVLTPPDPPVDPPLSAVNIPHKIVKKNLKNMAVIQPRPTHILYQCAQCGDDRTSFNVICDVCDV